MNKRAARGVVVWFATLLLTTSLAAAQDGEAADDGVRAWREQTTQRWSAILQVAVTTATKPSYSWPARTEELRADRRVRVTALRRELDQAVAAVRAYVNQADPAPDYFALTGVRNDSVQAALEAIPDDQRRALDRLATTNAFIEEIQLASLDGGMESAIASRIIFHAQFREVNWIMAAWVKSDDVVFVRDSFPDIWWRLYSLDQHAEFVDHDAQISILRGRTDELQRARAEINEIADEMRTMAPLLRRATAHVAETLLPPALIPEERREPAARLRENLPAFPAEILRHADGLQAYAASWAVQNRDTVAAEYHSTFPSLMVRLTQLSEGSAPPL